jgi:hypothetical protein
VDGAGTMFNVEQGVEYFIQVYGFYSFMAGRADQGDVVLNINTAKNTRWQAAQEIEGESGARIGTAKDAMKANGGNQEAAAVWFRWIAPADLPIQFSITPPGGKLRYPYSRAEMEVFAGEPSSASELGRGEQVSFLARKGTAYYIAIRGEAHPPSCFQLAWKPALLLVPELLAQSVSFQLHSSPMAKCVVESSSDLKEWTIWRQFVNKTGATRLTFTTAELSKQLFLRARTE